MFSLEMLEKNFSPSGLEICQRNPQFGGLNRSATDHSYAAATLFAATSNDALMQSANQPITWTWWRHLAEVQKLPQNGDKGSFQHGHHNNTRNTSSVHRVRPGEALLVSVVTMSQLGGDCTTQGSTLLDNLYEPGIPKKEVAQWLTTVQQTNGRRHLNQGRVC